jgi:hypothetical protein
MRPHFNLASLLAVVTPVLSVQLPYSATTLLTTGNGSITYILSPASGTQASLGVFNASNSIAVTSQPDTLFTTLPFLSGSESKPYIPLADDQGITVLTGDCGANGDPPELWRFAPQSASVNGTWTKLKLSVNGYNLKPNYLSAGVAFPASDNDVVPTLYIFGGMCPSSGSSTASNWITNANYSSQMLALAPATSTDPSSPYSMAATGLRAPPIPEAGLTMTPLTTAFSSSGSASQQQNFVLIGGHTQNAFINMSQVAMFSLPQGSWAFLPVAQPQGTDNTELVRRDAVTVEPRSGHTAVLTQDGTQIIVVGGWVGDTDTPAQPQVAILNVGEDYGGRGDWEWTVPSTKSPFSATSGIYGHGATLLQGGVMMLAGGVDIGSGASKAKRQSSSIYRFLNTTSMEWSTSYTYASSASGPNVNSNSSASGGLNKSEKVGIGAGVGLSFAAIAIIVSIWFWYSRRIRRERYLREKELRELALGAERSFDPGMDGGVDQRYPERRSASWADMQEKSMQGVGRSLPWNDNRVDDIRQAERTGAHMDVPSPTRGLRKNLQSRPQFGQQGGYLPGGPPGSVFRIDEEEENSQSGSLRKIRTPQPVVDRGSTYSDPFKDPPRTADSADDAAEQRKKEVQSWVEDWQSAAESMLSRNPSQAQTDRTYSNLSQAYAPSHARSKSNGSNLPSGRGSPEKSDRTGSNLSEQSVYSQMSFQRSVAGTVSRKESQRSASAGQAIFSGAAAAALGRLRGQPQPDSADSGVSREASKRSVSMRDYFLTSRQPEMRERTDTFSSSPERRSFGPIQPGERHALLGKLDTQSPRGYGDDEETSPTKATREVKYTRTSSLTSRTGAMAMGLLGSVKRVITGTGSVNVHDRVAAFENKSGQTSPTKTDRYESPKRPLSPSQEFWKGKQGPQDWGDASVSQSTGTVRRKPLPNNAFRHSSGDPEEWDVESAVQNRVVQVMFTMPKEKLRVVNADALSLLSSNQSDVDHEEAKDREKEVKRMSSVREADEPDGRDKGRVLGCDVD